MGEAILSPGSVVGSYEINRLIASGGMGEVYLATHTTMSRKAAIKVIYPYLTQDDKFIERWRREARALAALQHPHIVDVYDAGVADGRYYIAMAYLPNGTLKSRLDELRKSGATMQVDDALAVIQQMATTLDYAHRNGIIHRDVKPSNILIAADGRYVLSDFGIASHLGATRVTRDYSALGSAEYMSPEQAQGMEITPSSDVYSLGVVAFEMLSGRLPFVADTVMAMLYKHVNEPPPTITCLRADLPAGIKDVINKSLEKNPAKRYASAAEMATAIQTLRTQKPAVGSRRTLIVGVIAAIALVGSGVVIAVGTRLVGAPPRTPAPSSTATLVAPATVVVPVAATATATLPATNTPDVATRIVPTPTRAPSATPQPAATSTSTSISTLVPTPTPTPVPPTATPVPTSTDTPAPTRTPRPVPTRTRTPLPTSVPTETPVPPSPTSPPQSSGGGGGGNSGGGNPPAQPTLAPP